MICSDRSRARDPVEGHTDNVPIRGSLYPTQLGALDGPRVGRGADFLIGHGAAEMRMGASGYAACIR